MIDKETLDRLSSIDDKLIKQQFDIALDSVRHHLGNVLDDLHNNPEYQFIDANKIHIENAFHDLDDIEIIMNYQKPKPWWKIWQCVKN